MSEPAGRPAAEATFAAAGEEVKTPTSPADSLAIRAASGRSRRSDLERRVTYLMLFRVVVISLVLGATLLVAWLSKVDLASTSSLALFGIIATTYALTIVYALAIGRVRDPSRLGDAQLVADLAITTILVHITGGAQSAYSFFFPLSIIGAATLRFRRGALVVAVVSALLFVGVSLAGWSEALPVPAGQRVLPADQTPLELARSLGLNIVAFAGVAILAFNLGDQIQRTSAVLESERSATADLLALHEDIVRSLASGLVTADPDGAVLTVNNSAADILELHPPDAVRAPLERILPGIGARIAALGPREHLRRSELTIERDDRPDLVLGISVSPLFDHRDRVLGRVINFQDLTELRQMEHRYKQAERLAVVGSLAAGVAHEIRNPLASISGSLELLRSGPDADPDTTALTEIVTREIDRLNALITDLLDYTNPQPRELAEIDLGSLASETLQVFSRDRDFEDVEVARGDGSSESGPRIVADAGKLQQVLWNLVRNAAQAASRGGGHVTVHVTESGGGVEIAIEDDGPGIAEEHRERVFDPFFTTKSRGSGLGLATVQNIVHAHGGVVRAESRRAGGCRFVVTLPRSCGENGADGA